MVLKYLGRGAGWWLSILCTALMVLDLLSLLEVFLLPAIARVQSVTTFLVHLVLGAVGILGLRSLWSTSAGLKRELKNIGLAYLAFLILLLLGAIVLILLRWGGGRPL